MLAATILINNPGQNAADLGRAIFQHQAISPARNGNHQALLRLTPAKRSGPTS